MKENKPFSSRDRLQSFVYAFEGLAAFFRTQHNAWIHLVAAAIVIVLGCILEVSPQEWCWLIAMIALVFICEMFNTSLEFLTDLASPEIHPLAKKVKDVAAAAVMIAAIAAVAIACIIFLPYFL